MVHVIDGWGNLSLLYSYTKLQKKAIFTFIYRVSQKHACRLSCSCGGAMNPIFLFLRFTSRGVFKIDLGINILQLPGIINHSPHYPINSTTKRSIVF